MPNSQALRSGVMNDNPIVLLNAHFQARYRTNPNYVYTMHGTLYSARLEIPGTYGVVSVPRYSKHEAREECARKACEKLGLLKKATVKLEPHQVDNALNNAANDIRRTQSENTALRLENKELKERVQRLEEILASLLR